LLWFHIIIDFFFFFILLIVFIIRDRKRKKSFEKFVKEKVVSLINEFDTIANWQIARLENKINELKKLEYEITHIYNAYIPEELRKKIKQKIEEEKDFIEKKKESPSVKAQAVKTQKRKKKKNPFKAIILMFFDAKRFYERLKKREKRNLKENEEKKTENIQKNIQRKEIQKEVDGSTVNKKPRIDIILNDEEIVFLESGKTKKIHNISDNRNIKKYEFQRIEREKVIERQSEKINKGDSLVDMIYSEIERGISEEDIIKKYGISYTELLLIKSQKVEDV